jgi:hypothetical protein
MQIFRNERKIELILRHFFKYKNGGKIAAINLEVFASSFGVYVM